MARIACLLAVVLARLGLESLLTAADAPARAGAVAQSQQALPIELAMGGVGGAYFLAEPGELVVEIEKRDRNRRTRHAELRAILLGPDRRVVSEVTLPDDGLSPGRAPGPPQRARLIASVERKGVYVLNVTVSQDRYGEEVLWGIRTNCPRWLIEIARGHRDQRREEPLVFAASDRPADVCFLPRKGSMAVELTGLPRNAKAAEVYDAQGALVETLASDAEGKVAHVFPADAARGDAPWRVHLPSQQASLQIDGLTRWDAADLYPNLPLWSGDVSAYFPLAKYRWLVTPYGRTVYGTPGQQGETVFQVHNNSGARRTIALGLEFSGAPWPAALVSSRVTLGPKQEGEVRLRYTVPGEGESRQCHLRATPLEEPDFSTYATLTVQAGTAPATRPLSMPITLTPYRHENEQFGYLPDYPVESQYYFDPANRPYTLSSGRLSRWSDGAWQADRVQAPLAGRGAAVAWEPSSTKIGFDRDGGVYLLATARRAVALVYSRDGGKTFSVATIPGRENEPRAMNLEVSTGHNGGDGPPPLLRFTRTASDPKRIWRKINDLELFLPERSGDAIALGEPILISRHCIGLSTHSGIPSSVVSRGTKVHVIWAEATEPEEKVPGVPTFVVSYDRATRSLGRPVLIGYGAPPNDVHNSPSITMDRQGYLHALVGTHGRPFQYARSLVPNDAHGGWTPPEPTGEGLQQTYIGLVCGADDTLHLAFRLWHSGEAPFPASQYAALAYQRKPPGKPWEPPRTLVLPAFSEYSVYYHRLGIDRAGRLMLSYDYWSTFWFYRTDQRGSRRALIVSADGGRNWKLAEGRDLHGE